VRRLLLALLALPLLAPAPGKASRLPAEELVLDNGLRLLVVPRPGAVLAAAGWIVRSGSADEPAGATGAAHLLEHLLFHGSRRLGRGAYARVYAEAGAVGINAVTEKDFSLYYLLLPANKLELWFWMESDRLLGPLLDGVADELPIVREERRQRLESRPTGLLEERLEAALWEGHPYAWPPAGRAEDLARLRPDAVRDFFARHYRAGNLAVAIVGDVESAAIAALARDYLGRLPAAAGAGRAEAGAEPAAGERRVAGACACAPQARVLYRTVPAGHADAPALDVLAGLLSGRSGRLHRRLVLDRPLAFAAWAEHLTRRRGGVFGVTVEGREGSSPAALAAAWEEELARLFAEPPAPAELERVRNQVTTDAERRRREPLGVLVQLLTAEALGGWRDLAGWTERALAVGGDDLRRVTERYLRPERRAVGLFERESGAAAATGGREDGD
jgi:zinc protease